MLRSGIYSTKFRSLIGNLYVARLYYGLPSKISYPYPPYDFLKVSVGICLCGHVSYSYIRTALQTYSTLF